MGELGHPISRLSLSLRWFASNFPNNPIYPYSPCPSQSTPDLKLFELPVSSTLEVWDRPAWIPLVPHLTGTGRDIVFSHAHVTLYEGLSVRPSVGRSVGPSFRNAFFFNRGIQAKKWSNFHQCPCPTCVTDAAVYTALLNASTHLYMRVCPSVRRSVGPSVTSYFKNLKMKVFLRVFH